MRKKIAAANWKMNTTVEEGKTLLQELFGHSLDPATEVVICPPMTHLYDLKTTFAGQHFQLGAQNMSSHEHGAYTGETSAAMLLSCGVSHVIIGHSERRQYFKEDDDLLGSKLRKALEHRLIPIFCCGEVLAIRKRGDHVPFVLNQLKTSFKGLNADNLTDLVIAYEPVWAIGTGETASPEQAQEMHASVRGFLNEEYGAELAKKVPILYGGSVKPANAGELFGQSDVDGGLVGGASLKAESFAAIINAF